MMLVFMLPTEAIIGHMPKSAEIIRDEGEYPVLSDLFRSTADNHTDALMLLEASDLTADSALEGALKVYDSRIGDFSTAESLTGHFLDGVAYTKADSYPRYWHGYLVILKSLLMLADLGTIRIVNAIVQILLLVAVCVLLTQSGFMAYVTPYVLAYLMLRPVALFRCLQFSTCYYVFTISIIAMLLLYRNNKLQEKILYVFLYAGIYTAFLDYLTYPIATVGAPMALYLILDKEKSFKDRVLDVIRLGLAWAAGYGIMWALKWVIASVLTNENVISDAVSAVMERTSTVGYGGTEHFSIASSVIWNIKAFVYTPVTVRVFAYFIAIAMLCVRNNRISKDSMFELLPFLLVAMLPIVWYMATTNHSCFHTFFTNKGCVVSLIAVMFGFTRICVGEGSSTRV